MQNRSVTDLTFLNLSGFVRARVARQHATPQCREEPGGQLRCLGSNMGFGGRVPILSNSATHPRHAVGETLVAHEEWP